MADSSFRPKGIEVPNSLNLQKTNNYTKTVKYAELGAYFENIFKNQENVFAWDYRIPTSQYLVLGENGGGSAGRRRNVADRRPLVKMPKCETRQETGIFLRFAEPYLIKYKYLNRVSVCYSQNVFEGLT